MTEIRPFDVFRSPSGLEWRVVLTFGGWVLCEPRGARFLLPQIVEFERAVVLTTGVYVGRDVSFDWVARPKHFTCEGEA